MAFGTMQQHYRSPICYPRTMQNETHLTHVPLSRLLPVLLCLLAPSLAAQSAAPRGATSTEDAAGEDVVKLSPFVITAEEDDGYRATSTLAGTRIKTELKDVGSAITVVTKDLLDDTATTGNESLLVYTPNTEAAGLDGNFGVTGTAQGFSDVMLKTDANNRIRALSAADNTRDFFISDIPWDTYNVDRVEVQRGPNSILYGLGKPGGLVNASLARAGFKNRNQASVRVGSHGSVRSILDLNHVLLRKQLTVRVIGLKDRQKYQQDPAYKDDERIYATVRYDPSFLNRGNVHTTLRASYEDGRIKSNNPRVSPPIDRITPWFETGTTTVNGVTYNNLNRQTFDFRYWTAYFANVPRSGWLTRTSPNYQPSLGTTFGGPHAYFDTGPTPSAAYYVSQVGFTTSGGLAPNGSIDRTIGGLWAPAARAAWIGTTQEIAVNQRVPFASAYVNKSLTDPSIFDFYNSLLDGPNKSEGRNFDALNLVLSQTYWNNRAGIELAADRQSYEDYANTMLTSVDFGITVDVNEIRPDGTPNPNVGRPVIYGRSFWGSGGAESERTSYRATAFAEVRATDFLERSWLTRLLGRHVFTANASRDKVDRVSRRWASTAVDGSTDFGLLRGAINPQRELQYTIYLGPDLRNATTASGTHISAPQTKYVVPDGNLIGFKSTWKQPTDPSNPGYVNPAARWVNPFNNTNSTQSENPANYIGWQSIPVNILNASEGDRDALTIVAGKSRDEVESEVLVWQGYLLDSLVVPTFGYRRDKADSYNATAPLSPDGYRDQMNPSYAYGSSPNASVRGTSRSWSVVMHSPQFIRDRLPLKMNVSVFYNESRNFEPSAGRVDMLNRPLVAPNGETKDYGVMISLLDERVNLKVNKYESTAAGSSFAFANQSFIGNIESRTWVSAKRFEAGLSGDPRYEGPDYNYGRMVNGVFVQTAEDKAAQQRDVRAVLDAFRPEIGQAWNITFDDFRWQSGAYEPWANGLPGFQPAGMLATTDSTSEGYEIELQVRPVKNWDILVNASKTTAARTNIGGTAWREWVDQRNTVWNGPGGNLRTTSGLATDTYREQWNANFYNNYALQRQLEGALAGQLRPWRINLITNYRFIKGVLKGSNVGGSYRWEDKVAIGYPSVLTSVNGVDLESVDVTRPYYGPSHDTVNIWLGYVRPISRNIRWRIQLNVGNILGKNELVPVSVQPDGSPGAFRIRQGTTWSLTNTITF